MPFEESPPTNTLSPLNPSSAHPEESGMSGMTTPRLQARCALPTERALPTEPEEARSRRSDSSVSYASAILADKTLA